MLMWVAGLIDLETFVNWSTFYFDVTGGSNLKPRAPQVFLKKQKGMDGRSMRPDKNSHNNTKTVLPVLENKFRHLDFCHHHNLTVLCIVSSHINWHVLITEPAWQFQLLQLIATSSTPLLFTCPNHLAPSLWCHSGFHPSYTLKISLTVPLPGVVNEGGMASKCLYLI